MTSIPVFFEFIESSFIYQIGSHTLVIKLRVLLPLREASQGSLCSESHNNNCIYSSFRSKRRRLKFLQHKRMDLMVDL